MGHLASMCVLVIREKKEGGRKEKKEGREFASGEGVWKS
jgi:hypothetical protein